MFRSDDSELFDAATVAADNELEAEDEDAAQELLDELEADGVIEYVPSEDAYRLLSFRAGASFLARNKPRVWLDRLRGDDVPSVGYGEGAYGAPPDDSDSEDDA